MIRGILILAAFGAQAQDEADRKAEEAVKAFNEFYKSPEALDRAAAVRDLANVRHEKCLKVLARLLLMDDAVVRKAAAAGLGGYEEALDLREKAAAALLNGIQPNLKDDPVLEEIFDSLGKTGAAAAPSVHKLFDHKKVLIARGAVRASGDMRLKESIEPLIALFKQLERNKPPDDSRGKAPSTGYDQGADRERWDKLRQPVIDALRRITDQEFKTAAEAEDWWRKNKATFKVEEKKK